MDATSLLSSIPGISSSSSANSTATGGKIGDTTFYGNGASTAFGLAKVLAVIGGAAVLLWIWKKR